MTLRNTQNIGAAENFFVRCLGRGGGGGVPPAYFFFVRMHVGRRGHLVGRAGRHRNVETSAVGQGLSTFEGTLYSREWGVSPGGQSVGQADSSSDGQTMGGRKPRDPFVLPLRLQDRGPQT